MIYFKIYNDDKLRHWNNFPKMNDPSVLEGTLLRIINEYLYDNGSPLLAEFDIHNPFIANMYFTYYTSSNFNAWGELPLGYIYNDMIRHIQNQNTSNNFIMTLESIFIDKNSTLKSYAGSFADPEDLNIAYEIITSYITENYLNSYNYIMHNNNGVMVAVIPKVDGLMAYILGVGFNPIQMSKWFCTDHKIDNPIALPYTRKASLIGIVRSKLGNRVSMSSDFDTTVNDEMADNKTRINIKNCESLIKSYDISCLRKKSEYDTEVKYGNYPIDYNWLNIYDICMPAAYLMHTFKSGETMKLNRFNQPEYRVDYRLLKRQVDILKIADKLKMMK